MHDITRSISNIKQIRSLILSSRRDIPLLQNSLADVKRVVIINSSSRSGSSLLYALLGRLPQVYSLTGEAAPFYKLNSCLDGFNPHLSDRIPTERIDNVIDLAGISQDFLSDMFLSETGNEEIDADGYVEDLMLRFLLQWPDVELDPTLLMALITQALEQYLSGHDRFCTEDFYLELLEKLSSAWPAINPFYYDIGTDKVALRFPSLDIPSGAPATSFTIEEPPFVLLSPRRRPTSADLSDKTLLLKSTVDCYRMNLVDRLFPNADIRVIHLVRNPAATINGIYDGWHHRGFFSHNLEHSFDGSDMEKLNIKGYSDMYPFGGNWWNFDLPVGWQEFANSELVDVCAFQWRSANSEIMENLAQGRMPGCRVHFEDIISSAVSRMSEFERILDFMGIPAEQAGELGLDVLPVVQSTLPPQLYRWKKREDMISKVLSASNVLEMAAYFGYCRENMETWL
jgi:hypothetical protein